MNEIVVIVQQKLSQGKIQALDKMFGKLRWGLLEISPETWDLEKQEETLLNYREYTIVFDLPLPSLFRKRKYNTFAFHRSKSGPDCWVIK